MTLRNAPVVLRSLIIAGGLALGFTIAACAEDESFDNVAGCEAYISDISAVFEECVADASVFENSVDCSVYDDVTTCDIGDYWACLGGAYSCDMDTMVVDVDAAALSECANLASCD